jgi:ABC-2 type transport system permease protein
MKQFSSIFWREFMSYFSGPLATVFIVVFLLATGLTTFSIAGWYETEQANLQAFFMFHPWIYLFFLPALSMRLWAEERRSGSIELLLTLPIPLVAIVAGKFLAAWAVAGLALSLTFPLWLSVNYLGAPDNGVILASYIGSFFMAGGYLALGSAMSATTRNQIIAFILTLLVCFAFTVTGLPMVLDAFRFILPDILVDSIASFSFLVHFKTITAGVIDLRGVIFFASLIVIALFTTVIIVEEKKAEGA